MQNPTTIELGDNDSIVITKNGMVIGFVQLARVQNDNIELVANPVTFFSSTPLKKSVFNSFSTTLATNVPNIENIKSAKNFTEYMNKKVN